MRIDIDQTLQEMIAAAEEAFGKGWKRIKDPAQNMIHRQRERFEMLSQMRTEGLLSEEEFAFRLQEQKDILQANLEALEVRGKVLAQNAANAAIKVFEKAVSTLL
jgi:hypothetical protein